VHATHLAGFIHRDIKAGNVMISERDGRREVKLLDFGIAKLVKAVAPQPGLTEPGAFLGTAFGMPPEQIRCEQLDVRVDIYALGVLIYHMLTGEYPFEASDPREIVRLHLYAPPPRPSQRAPVSPAVDAVVLRCLEKQREQRFANVPELIVALRSAINNTPGDAPEASTRALGVYVNLTSKLDEVIDDDMFEAMGEVLDAVEQVLGKLDFALPFRGTNALLAVRLLDRDATGNEHSQTLTSLHALRARLAKRGDLNIEIAVAIDTARYRRTLEHTEIIGGPLLDPSAWSTHPDTIHV
jgi:serine/threonine-protein kinase